jgi:tetratricopeptide (TPR) repeat protein
LWSFVMGDAVGVGQERVIRPGQEGALADMLGSGATLPGSCAFTGGQIEGGVIAATYACPTGDVVLELREVGRIPDALARTDTFAIVTRSGSLPPDLLDALLPRIRARESAIGWSIHAGEQGAEGSTLNRVGSAAQSWGAVLIAALAGAAIAVALWRAWHRSAGGLIAPRRGLRSALVVLLCAVVLALAAEVAYRAALYVAAARQTRDGAFEIYGVGESTMRGQPFEPKLSVPGMLDRMFGGAIAGRPIAIRNLAERGAPIYPQSVALERAVATGTTGGPGAVLIMSGHNEGYISAADGTGAPYQPNCIAERSAIVRDVLVAVRRRRLVDRDRSLAAYEYYLRRTIETAQASGLTPILTTLPSNISRIEPNLDAYAADANGAIVEQGLALERQGRHAQARELYLARLAEEPTSASLTYRVGRCEEALGNFDAARERYWTAVDLDTRLMFGRATRAQHEVVRRLAREYGVPLVDGVEIFAAHSPHGIVGEELLIDGQHPTVVGYLLLAEAFARILSQRFDTPIAHPLHGERDVMAALGMSRHDLHRALVDAGSWLVSTSVEHPFPHDRMALAEKRFASALGNGEDFSAWFGIALTQAAARGGMLRRQDDISALGHAAGYTRSYSIPSSELSFLIARFQELGVDADVIEHLRQSSGSAAVDAHSGSGNRRNPDQQRNPR